MRFNINIYFYDLFVCWFVCLFVCMFVCFVCLYASSLNLLSSHQYGTLHSPVRRFPFYYLLHLFSRSYHHLVRHFTTYLSSCVYAKKWMLCVCCCGRTKLDGTETLFDPWPTHIFDLCVWRHTPPPPPHPSHTHTHRPMLVCLAFPGCGSAVHVPPTFTLCTLRRSSPSTLLKWGPQLLLASKRLLMKTHMVREHLYWRTRWYTREGKHGQDKRV